MKTQMVALAVVAAIGTAAPAGAQDARAAEILGKARQALGGKKLEALETLSLEAAVQRNVGNMQLSSDLELLLEMPDKYLRNEVSGRGMGRVMTTGFNGDKAILPPGVSMGAGGATMVFRMGPGGPAADTDAPKPTPEQLAELNRMQLRTQRTELSRLMLGWFGSAHPSLNAQYTYAGEAESADGKAHVIDVKDTDGFTARLFIDQNNFLPLMVTYKGRQPRMMTSGGPAGAPLQQAGSTSPAGAHATRDERKKLPQDAAKQIQQTLQEQPEVDFSMFFDDWREVDGIRFPHVMRRAVAGTTNEEWTISKVKVNPKIDAKKFAVPETK